MKTKAKLHRLLDQIRRKSDQEQNAWHNYKALARDLDNLKINYLETTGWLRLTVNRGGIQYDELFWKRPTGSVYHHTKAAFEEQKKRERKAKSKAKAKGAEPTKAGE